MIKSKVALLVFVSFIAQRACADTIRHFEPPGTAPGQFPRVSTLLDSVGIGASNAASETTASTFIVPGTGMQDLTFRVVADFGSFLYDFGFFDISTATANPVSDKRNFAVQALSAATQVFDDRNVNPGDTMTIQVQGGRTLGFFIVPNNTIAGFLADPDAFYGGSQRAPLFSNANANPGEFDQFLSFIGNGVTLFTFEDLSRAGSSDNSFTDLGFSINRELVPEPSTVLLLCAGMIIVIRSTRTGGPPCSRSITGRVHS